MLKLYGFSVSNYYNMVKLALLEKGLPFEEVLFYAGQAPDVLAVSPRGKVPVLQVRARGESGELRAVMFGYACHATVLSLMEIRSRSPSRSRSLAVTWREPGRVATTDSGPAG